MDVTICIATYGSEYWEQLGEQCMQRLFEGVKPRNYWHVHSETGEDDCSIAGVRNYMLYNVESEYVIFLDADDWLEDNYVLEMSRSDADVIVPAVRYHRNRVAQHPHIPKVSGCPCEGFCGPDCLDRGNYVVIGAAARTEALRAVGGFREWPMYEDWDLWLRVAKAGYSFENMPTAIYNANWSETSRNRAPTQAQRLEAHRAIAIDNGVWVP